ncbi:RNA-binding protein 42 [Acrasis kona]|uniref:RNA-binding protein n=1 Tax=Acrasis kona TaxID=1008807 RepID=A0AAW2ZFQ7_9EUKA
MSDKSKDVPQKKLTEAEIFAQLQKLQQEISNNLPLNNNQNDTQSKIVTSGTSEATTNKTIGVKRKTEDTGSQPAKKQILFVPRNVAVKQEQKKVISAAPTYNFNSFVTNQQQHTNQLLTDYYVQQQANKFHAQKAKNQPTFEDELSLDPNYSGPKKKKVLRQAAGEVWEDPTLAEWSENDYRIFVGDLGNEVNDDVLTRSFSQFSSFQKAKVVMDKRTGKSKGYGFVSFSNSQDYVNALQQMDGKYIGNRPCKLRRSRWKDRNA